ncbi:hypothetical protein AB0L66_10785 [Streptomyces sp. NPDC052207]|uniref:hypothetical protein n=1 Tax=Streptomyces sp. NPDC052207 TaxID=3155418 RepID=UPI00343AA085
MVRRLAVASTASCLAGGVFTGYGLYIRNWETAVIGFALMAAGTAGMLASTMSYLLRRFEARTRQDMDQLAEERRLLEREMLQREHDLERREEALQRQRVAAALVHASMAKNLDDTRNQNQELRARVMNLEHELDEVNDERNQLVAHELLMANAQFAPRMYGVLQAASGDQAPARLRRLSTQVLNPVDNS